ncbi:MAG TPA: 4-alpha-glucanotransferase, partial [Opitutaceae bacterium]|nr:4-alpha-glucanotransferase [Opitutaceae bacterium]
NRKLAPYGDFEAFKKQQAHWLSGYAYFQALKSYFGGKPWWEWPDDVRFFSRALQSPLRTELGNAIEAQEFFQYLFFGQWTRLKAKANKLGISIIGDVPIFVARDSADVWSHPDLFQLDQKTGEPLAIAGVPPDYFSEDGQLWGNPLYDWAAHAKDGYAWWLSRFDANFALYDIIRIDHFRGFDAYWSVAFGAPNARKGKWKQGPGIEFFKAVQAHRPDAKLIAEDLGVLTPSVVELRKATGLPGMAILQFAFGGDAENFYLPHNHTGNSVVYPGTHDNDTTVGWYASIDEKTRDHIRRYLRITGSEISWDFIRTSYESVSRLAVFPLQDLLSLGSEARFNSPGKPENNWQWRYRPTQLEKLHRDSAPYLKQLGTLYGR